MEVKIDLDKLNELIAERNNLYDLVKRLYYLFEINNGKLINLSELSNNELLVIEHFVSPTNAIVEARKLIYGK